MVVDERFGALLGVSQGDAMDDSGGQGFGGVFAGGASVEERTAGGRNQSPRLDVAAGQGGGGGSSPLVLAEGGDGGDGGAAMEVLGARKKRGRNRGDRCLQYQRMGSCEKGDLCKFKHGK